MNRLFWGAIFAFLNIDLNFGDMTVGLLPGFIGWYVIWKGLTELRDQSVHFEKVRTAAVMLIAYSAVIYVLALLPFPVDFGWVSVLLRVLASALSLYVMYGMIRGIQDLEVRCGTKLNGASMLQIWKFDVVLELCDLVVTLLSVPAAALILTIAVVVLKILLLIRLCKARNAYQNRPLEEISSI